jgi:hypothetical protein
LRGRCNKTVKVTLFEVKSGEGAGMVVYACDFTYLGDGDREDFGFRHAPGNKHKTLSEK